MRYCPTCGYRAHECQCDQPETPAGFVVDEKSQGCDHRCHVCDAAGDCLES